MLRRSFLPLLATPFAAAQSPARKPMMLDANGEIRRIYTPELIREILASGTNMVAITVTDPKEYGANALPALLADLREYDRYFAAPHFVRVLHTADIDRARAEGRLGILYQIQNAAPLERDAGRVETLRALGVRSIQLTYNHRNLLGDGCFEPSDAGLSEFGREVIAAMNEARMLVDLSHGGMRTITEAVRASRKPVVISHTACRSVFEHRRGVTDAVLRTVAEHGGFVGIAQIRTFLTTERTNNLRFYLDHIDHAVRVAGIDHVGIGSDRDHRVIPDTREEIEILLKEEGVQFQPADWPLYLEGLNGPRRMERVWDELKKRGYSADRVEKILGRNLYRVYSESIG
jgi:membrane dipeptidase